MLTFTPVVKILCNFGILQKTLVILPCTKVTPFPSFPQRGKSMEEFFPLWGKLKGGGLKGRKKECYHNEK
jgi:hypothetical protein